MGCGIFCCCNKMSLFRGHDNSDSDDRTKLERKLYIARESPDSIFDLSDCRLRHVPSGIYAICKVLRKEQLLLQNNLLKTIEDGGAFSDLFLIKVLNLSCNHLHQLNPDIKYLNNLNELHLQDNKISCLPETIGHLNNLQLLDVSKNNLKLLPKSVKSLKNLRHLLLSNNHELKLLPPELGYVQNLVTLSIDDHTIVEPPAHVVNKGLFEIMTYLCQKSGIEYIPTSENNADYISKESSPVLSPFNKLEHITWEQQEAETILQESKLREAAKQQRQGFLSHMIKEQSELDSEIAKVYSEKEKERQKLISYIQQEETIISNHIDSLIKSGSLQPEVLKQQLEYERMEHDRLLAMCHENYNNNRKFDTLKAMETLLNEEYAIERSKKEYDSYIDNVKESLLMQELKITGKLGEIFRVKDEMNTHFVQQLLEDEDIQKALVASLLERTDARSWSLNQEIAIVTSNLARLSTIEHEKQKLQIEYNYTQLLEQRVQLLTLLDELLVQQQQRRNQLMRTLQDMEENAYEKGANFWLANYQRLIDSTPHSLRQVGRNLDPHFANCLVEEGVIHCLPFLVKFIFSETALSFVSKDDLRDNGVSLSSDREKILSAIAKYISTKNIILHETIVPSAPHLESTIEETGPTGIENLGPESQQITSECAICMENQCEIVFVPCGHMCCCAECAKKELVLCPMCRSNIEKRIKVIMA